MEKQFSGPEIQIECGYDYDYILMLTKEKTSW